MKAFILPKLSRFFKLASYFYIFLRYYYLIYRLKDLKTNISDTDECIIVGNGPSLNESLKEDFDFINTKKIFCVNDFSRSDYYEKLKPSFYVLTDPAFWEKYAQVIIDDIKNNNTAKYNKTKVDHYKGTIETIESTFNNIIEKTKWNLNLFVPLQSKPTKIFDKIAEINRNIKIHYYLMTPINFKIEIIRHKFYKLNLGMPTPQTVMIAAIFLALNINFKKIYLIGVDHSWHEYLVVDQNNCLHVKDYHFYDKDKTTITPLLKDKEVRTTVKIHEQFYALYIAFRSHILIEKYSKSIGAKIYNSSKKTYIDAYDRYKL
jgi:hypothetical protein